jgi:hypothetical protein
MPAPSFTTLQDVQAIECDMASSLRIEVRDLRGQVLPEFGFDVDDIRSPGDHSALARFMLDRLRDAGRLYAYSVHFIRGSNKVGSWSIERSNLTPQ